MTTTNLYTRQPTEIVMYSVDWCPDCKRAKFFFKRNNINVIEVNVDNDEKGAAFVREINSGSRSVPTIILPDGSVLVEPSNTELSERFSKS
jgi:mycoredoxin